ncbi:MAG: 5'/3'-nucleotidase SurE [Bacteroidales bacterium]|nr:5'/3'-nucleotidase SurE [Bacteroidales bacterium]
MNILITNDDGYFAKGIQVLARIMKPFGNVTVIAPKTHQSGMGMAVSLGLKQIKYKDLGTDKNGVRWAYLDATPASCVKYGINFMDQQPDVVISGINHGTNASTAACYSGTLGAAEEAAINGIPAFGVSLNTIRPDADFECVETFFPELFRQLMNALPERPGIYYNINFPNLPAEKVKGVRIGHQGMGKWIKEFTEWNPAVYERFGLTPESFGQSTDVKLEEGEKLYMMVGQYVDDPENRPGADHHLVEEGYIAIMSATLDRTDYIENERLRSIGLNKDFK